MVLAKIDRLSLYSELKKRLTQYSHKQIESGVMRYCLVDFNCALTGYDDLESREISDILKAYNLPTDLETIVEFYESLLEEDNKDTNGIVFTPKYISDYIVSKVLQDITAWDSSIQIIDPGCGCGIFLISAAENLLSRFSVDIDTIIRCNIYGIELDSDNARRCKLVLQLLSAKYGGNYQTIDANIQCLDSLKNNWSKVFNLSSFGYIIGNPPYVNPHDMDRETVKFLKENFVTTTAGVFNIFYAFIEHAMKFLSPNGTLGYIVPNNFLTIKSALDLREFLQQGKCIKSIIDFGDNMVFRPVRTYNCIILLSKQQKDQFEYYVMPKADEVEIELQNIHFNIMPVDKLDKNGWKLVDEQTRCNLRRIESQLIPIKEFIRTGIATLSDGVYLVEQDENGYFKSFSDGKIYIEQGLVKPIYKVPELKLHDNIEDAKRYIIFPYKKTKDGHILISESELKENYPQTYICLCKEKDTLDSRDKGKGAAQGWYAYGRTQGLNKYGKKLLFPTFAKRPKFLYVDNEDDLFCNGYAVFENDRYELDILVRILNSRVMEYYVSNTSYSIDGGYYCYQKKYVERFSLPLFTEDVLAYIRTAPTEELDSFLWKIYGLE